MAQNIPLLSASFLSKSMFTSGLHVFVLNMLAESRNVLYDVNFIFFSVSQTRAFCEVTKELLDTFNKNDENIDPQ